MLVVGHKTTRLPLSTAAWGMVGEERVQADSSSRPYINNMLFVLLLLFAFQMFHAYSKCSWY